MAAAQAPLPRGRQDIEHELGPALAALPPLDGIPLVSLESALQAAFRGDAEFAALAPDLQAHLHEANLFASSDLLARKLPDGARGERREGMDALENEEVKAVHLLLRDSPLWRSLNARLRFPDRTVLQPCLPLLKLLLMGMYKLPRVSASVHCELTGDLREHFPPGMLLTWWGFTSGCSNLSNLSQDVREGGPAPGPRTLLVIHACAALDPRACFPSPDSSELLFAPGTTLRVAGVYSPSADMHIVSLVQGPYVALRLRDERTELRMNLESVLRDLAAAHVANAASQAEIAALHRQLQALRVQCRCGAADHLAVLDERPVEHEHFHVPDQPHEASELPAPAAPAPAPAPDFPPSRLIAGPVFSLPSEVCELDDGSFLVADTWGGAPAWQLWPDGSRPPQQLPPATQRATAVQKLGDGYLVVSFHEHRVERTGSIAWKRTDLKNPWAAVVVDRGNTALVTDKGAGQVVRLALDSGQTIGVVGKGVLKGPRGIAVGPGGNVFVADYGTKLVHVFDHHGTALRTLGAKIQATGLTLGLEPMGVSVDPRGRVYVAHAQGKTVVVLDGVSGAKLAAIDVVGGPRGVLVTAGGALVVTHDSPTRGISMWG